MSMVTPEAVHISAVVGFSVVLLVTMTLFYNLRRNLHQITSQKMKITTIICLFSIMVLSLFFVIWNSVKYIALISPKDDEYFFKSLSNIILGFRITSGIVNFIAVAYFITIKLEDVYKDTYLSINKRVINICFIIYVITIILWYIMLLLVHIASHWHPELANNLYQTLLTITTMAYSIASEIYFILILILFNVKLFKFISLTMKNNETLSLEINKRFQNFIIKQTNLISIITIAFIIFQIIAYWRWVKSVKDNMVNLLYPILFTLQQSIYAICIYLTFKFNNKYYKMSCKYCHYLCVYSCTKLTKHESQQQQSHYLSVSQSMTALPDKQSEYRYSQMSVVHIHCIIDKCSAFQKIFGILSGYKNEINQNLDKYDMTDILNAFNHLLKQHDSEDDFNKIHEKLNPNDSSSCNYKNCQIYSRHYSRRRRFVNKNSTNNYDISCNDDDEKEELNNYENDRNCYLMTDILDRLHTFYYHSYDTFKRVKLSQKFDADDEDDKISQIYKMIKGRSNAFNFLTNKFNSDLKLENNVKNDNIYSFGKRFEYEYKSSEWFVEPTYESLKSEFIDNQICNISIDEYNVEYSKCRQYMKTNQIKIIQSNEENQGIHINLSNHHILSLLVYCNCDYFQTKWSETFRRIPYNESNKSLKKRHSYFYYCSKYLRDLIEYFGSSLLNVDNENKTFYHGVNQLLYFTRTITKFNAPLSTSTEPTVALNFSGNIGVVLELKYSSSTYLLHAKYFDCAFFSDYVNEKESLFLGGVPILIITNIINVHNGKMYRKYINALNVINCVLNGTMETDNKLNYDFTHDSVQLCCLLLSYQLKMQNNDNNNNNHEFPEYIINLLNRYCINLNNIMVFWQQIEMVEKLKNLLCNNNKNDAMFFDLNVIFKLFPNLEQIEYFNKSSKNKLKYTVQQIIDDISSKQHNLKYVIIHHKGLLSLSSYKKNKNENDNYNKGWYVFQDDSKVIIYKQDDDDSMNFNLLNFRFNQINQANASKSMIRNLL